MTTKIAAALIAALIVSACAPPSPAPAAECLVPAGAWCLANFRCSGDRAQYAACMSGAASACAAWTPNGADAAQCAELQDELACSGASLVNDPESAGCLREFWRFPVAPVQ